MARRRMISQTVIYDEELNNCSIEAQWFWQRMLAVSDDCGVVPGSEYTLKTLTNPSSVISSKLQEILAELLNNRLIIALFYDGKLYYCFKPESFDEQQAYIIKNRTKSEYLKLKVSEFQELYKKQFFIKNLQEITGISKDNGSYHIESNKLRAKSKEQKEKAGKSGKGKNDGEGTPSPAPLPEDRGNSVEDSVPVKKNYVEQITEIFCEEYKLLFPTGYAVQEKDRKAAGLLARMYKGFKPSANTEEALLDFRQIFKTILRKTYSSEYLNTVTLWKINSNWNEYYQAITRNAGKNNRGFNAAGAREWLDELSGDLHTG